MPACRSCQGHESLCSIKKPQDNKPMVVIGIGSTKVSTLAHVLRVVLSHMVDDDSWTHSLSGEVRISKSNPDQDVVSISEREESPFMPSCSIGQVVCTGNEVNREARIILL